VDKRNNPTFQHGMMLGYFVLDITQADEIHVTGIVQFYVGQVCEVGVFNTQCKIQLMNVTAKVNTTQVYYGYGLQGSNAM
jgi:hypothetical protein